MKSKWQVKNATVVVKKAQVISINDMAVEVPAEHVIEDVTFTPNRQRGRKPKQQCTVCTESSHTPWANRLDFSLRRKGTIQKAHTRLNLAAELYRLKRCCMKKNVDNHTQDPLLSKLTVYHNRLSSQADNILMEKLSAEVAEVVNDLSQIDDVSRLFQ